MTRRYEVKIAQTFAVYANTPEEAKRLVTDHVKRVMTGDQEILAVAEAAEIPARLVQDYGPPTQVGPDGASGGGR